MRTLIENMRCDHRLETERSLLRIEFSSQPCWPAFENSLLHILGLLVAGLQLIGCAAAQVHEVRSTPASIDQDEALAIVVSYEARDLEREAVRCISEAVTKVYPSVRIVSPEEFRRSAFPDLAPEAAPHSSEYLVLLLNDPRFLQRIAPLRLRYLISVSGVTEQGVVGAGAGGPAGLVVWDRSTRFTASVLDLKQALAVKELEASASGNPWVLIVGGVPLGVPSMTESQACENLGKSVTRFLETGTKP